MKISCQMEDLLYGVQTVSRAVSGKNTLPVLAGILLWAEDNRLFLQSTNLELAIECYIPAEVESAGKVVVPGKNFLDLVRFLPQGTISLEQTGEFDLTVRYEDSETVFRGMDPVDFPAFPEVQGDIEGSIPAPLFKKIVRQVAFAASTNEARPVFTGVLLDFIEGQLVMVATDTHRLAKQIIPWQGKGVGKVIVPAKTMQEIARFAAEDQQIDLIISKNQIYFRTGQVAFISRVINGQYPDYNQVIPKKESFITKSVIQSSRFLQEMERASVVAREGAGVIKLHFQQDMLGFHASAPDLGTIDGHMSILHQGEDIEVVYNSKYILEVLKNIEGDSLYMELTGPVTPGIITSDADENFLYLILPVRIG